MKNLALLKNAPNFAVILSLLLVAFELNQNQQSLLESNNPSQDSSSKQRFCGQHCGSATAVREYRDMGERLQDGKS